METCNVGGITSGRTAFGTVTWTLMHPIQSRNAIQMMLCYYTACGTVKISHETIFFVAIPHILYCSEPVNQLPPMRIFKTVDSYDEFLPMIYYQSYEFSPSTICASSWDTWDQNLASYVCSLYGAPADSGDMTYYWHDSAVGWDNWGSDYYTGNTSHDQIESVDIWLMEQGADSMDSSVTIMDWMISPAMDQSCSAQTNVLAVKCGSSDFCLESGQKCATDLDCCQSPDDPMYCQPSWGTCVHTV